MTERLYLGRRTKGGPYELGTRKEGWTPQGGFSVFGGNYLSTFCVEPFEKITGIKLRPGKVRRVKSITIELDGAP